MALSAPIAASTVGDNTIVAAVPNKKIRVKAWAVSMTAGTAAATATWKSGASTTLAGAFALAAIGSNVGQAAPNSDFLFETAAGQALVLALGAGGTTPALGGVVQYSLE
jgi:hypothetical protein